MIMSRPNETPLLFDLKTSTRLKRLIIVVHIIAGSACIANLLAIPIKVGFCMVICIHLGLVFNRLSRQKYQIRYTESSGWEISSQNGFEPIHILKSTFISTFIIILHAKSQNRDKLTILVLNDALCADDYRRLISQLKTTGIKNMG